MKTLIWNIRGTGGPQKTDYLKRVVQENKIEFLALLEPKKKTKHLRNIAIKLQFPHFKHFESENKHIWILWKDQVTAETIAIHTQHITLNIKTTDFSFIFTVIYASYECDVRLSLWNSLLELDIGNKPWIIGGDFNTIIDQSEKKGGRPYSRKAMEEFQEFISDAGLLDAGYEGEPYTWCSNEVSQRRTWIRLDRVLNNLEALSYFPQIRVCHLPRIQSDHCPLVLSLFEERKYYGSFKFQRQWIQEQFFKETMENEWHIFQADTPWHRLYGRLKHVKRKLKEWSKETRKEKQQQRINLEESICRLDKEIQNGWSEVKHAEYKRVQEQLNDLITQEEGTLRDKARVKWLKEGDRNTTYFHACIKERNYQTKWNFKLHDGTYSSNPDILGPLAVDYYSQILTADNNTPLIHPLRFPQEERIQSDLLEYIPSLITVEHNAELCKEPQWEEILMAIKGLDPDSAPGPDGFNGHFYQANAEIMKEDIIAVVQDFFGGNPMPKCITSTLIVLIPKKKNPQSFKDLRPISLCNFTYKIIAKILNDRLVCLLPLVISKEQSGFVQGRAIHENVAIAQEMVNELDRKAIVNMMIKVDMEKAYDRMEWGFILKVLERFGFSNRWSDMIFRCMSNNWFTLLVQGAQHGFFKSTRGLRQGDPLSPSIFILAQDAFSRKLNHLMNMTPFIGRFKGDNNFGGVSHLLYADDMIIFMEGNQRSLEYLKNLLQEYEVYSGQKVNVEKTRVIVSNKLEPSKKELIKQITGFSFANLPVKYLGTPLFKGRSRIHYFDEMVDAIANKVQNWKTKFLSQGGKLTLIKSVLSSMLIHTISMTKVPKTVIQRINSILAKFMWSKGDGHGSHWVKWQNICMPLEEGGLGVRNLEQTMQALQTKFAWRFVQGQSLWASVMRAKYGHPMKALRQGKKNAHSHTWKMILPWLKYSVKHGKWIIGEGKCYFWKDNWLGQPLWYPSCPQQDITVREALQNPDFIQEHLSGEQQEQANKIFVNQEPDRLVCDLSATGEFSASLVYHDRRVKKEKVHWAKFLWNKVVPPNIGLFMWKLIHHGIPVECNMQKRGVQLASKCYCCNKGEQETVDHVFMHSKLAQQLWRRFGDALQVPVRFTSISNFVSSWYSEASWHNQRRALVAILGGVIAREIWLARNSAKHNGECMSLFKINKQVTHWMLQLSTLIQVKVQVSFLDQISLVVLKVPMIHIPLRRGIWVHWQPPSMGQYKLNTDGSSIRGNNAGGGILRDHNGDLIMAFSTKLYPGSSAEAEAYTMLEGLKICHARNQVPHVIESDSFYLIQCMLNKWRTPWKLEYVIRQCLTMIPLHALICHVHREGNMVADRLANHGHAIQNVTIFDHIGSLPHSCLNVYVKDQLGLGNYRPP